MGDQFSDDSIRERHGIECRDAGDLSRSSVTINEVDDYVVLDGSCRPRGLTPYQARYLASKLYRLSRRIRQRSEIDQ